MDNVKPARGHGLAFEDQQDAVHNIVGYNQPYVTTTCANDTVNGSNDQSSVFFPISNQDLGPHNLTYKSLGSLPMLVPGVEYPPLRKAQLLEIPGSAAENRFKWVDAPASLASNQTSLGVIILQPQQGPSLERASVLEYIVCTIGAGWGTSSMNISTTSTHYDAASSLPDLHSVPNSRISRPDYNSVRKDYEVLSKSNPNIANYYHSSVDSAKPVVYSGFPQKATNIDPDWAEFLNPLVPPVNNTVLNILFTLGERTSNGGFREQFDVAQFAGTI